MADSRQLSLLPLSPAPGQYELSASARQNPVCGTVQHLFVAKKTGTPVTAVTSVDAEASRGLTGDFHGPQRPGGKRQVLLLEAASLQKLRLAPGALKENLVLEGVPLESLPAGQRMLLGEEVVMELSEPCVPCRKLEALRPGLCHESWGQRGVLARVLRSGQLRVGDGVRLLDVNPAARAVIRRRLP